jgi:predicted TIM-barrel fold metal-dependent hydrolase
VDNIIALGLHGVKLHPDFQLFNIDDDSAMPIYECIAGKLPLLIHMGDYRYEYSHPRRLAKVLDSFPELDCIAAHFGGYTVWDEALDYLLPRRCWADTSSTMGMVEDIGYMRELVKKWGTERLLFGTDFPMWDHAEELERFNALEITGDELEAIMGGNALALLARYER